MWTKTIIDYFFYETETDQAGVSEFQTIFDDCFGYVSGYFNNTTVSMKSDTYFLDSNDNQFNCTVRKSLPPRANETFKLDAYAEVEEETPLLEELEIYPDQIQQKAVTIVNPFASDELAFEQFLADMDLSGPIFFCFLFGSCLFLAGKVFIFSHVYGLSMVSVLGMYALLRLMSYGHQEHFITIKGVASALGYGMMHLVWFSFVGIFVHLNTMNGLYFAIPAVILATFGASRILCIMSNQPNKNALIAYPTAMIYILFAFLVTF